MREIGYHNGLRLFRAFSVSYISVLCLALPKLAFCLICELSMWAHSMPLTWPSGFLLYPVTHRIVLLKIPGHRWRSEAPALVSTHTKGGQGSGWGYPSFRCCFQIVSHTTQTICILIFTSSNQIQVIVRAFFIRIWSCNSNVFQKGQSLTSVINKESAPSLTQWSSKNNQQYSSVKHPAY